MATKTIRIALVIDVNGNWAASGWQTRGAAKPDKQQEAEFMNVAAESLDSIDFQTEMFIEVEVPVPEKSTPTIQGKIS